MEEGCFWLDINIRLSLGQDSFHVCVHVAAIMLNANPHCWQQNTDSKPFWTNCHHKLYKNVMSLSHGHTHTCLLNLTRFGIFLFLKMTGLNYCLVVSKWRPLSAADAWMCVCVCVLVKEQASCAMICDLTVKLGAFRHKRHKLSIHGRGREEEKQEVEEAVAMETLIPDMLRWHFVLTAAHAPEGATYTNTNKTMWLIFHVWLADSRQTYRRNSVEINNRMGGGGA